jgi:RHS repeat-associated protein
VIGVVDATGTPINTIIYDGYGNQTSQSNPANGDRYGFTARELDAVTGLLYDRARWYDPKTGRWTSQDPLGFDAGDADLYRYVGNSPTNANDPSGLDEDIPPTGPARFLVDMWEQEERRKRLTLAESVEYWKQKAREVLAAYPPKTTEDVINNNKKITAFYAKMYKTDPEAFLWFGIGAYASYGVGQGLRDTDFAHRKFPGLDVYGNKTDVIFNILAKGNLAIFSDLAWVTIAYQDQGMKELEKLRGSIDPDVYQAFVEMDKAR